MSARSRRHKLKRGTLERGIYEARFSLSPGGEGRGEGERSENCMNENQVRFSVALGRILRRRLSIRPQPQRPADRAGSPITERGSSRLLRAAQSLRIALFYCGQWFRVRVPRGTILFEPLS